jgi:hypothetical protein
VVREIADVFRREDPRLIVQKGDGLIVTCSISPRCVRPFAARCKCDLIVLLSRHFPGPVYSQHSAAILSGRCRRSIFNINGYPAAAAVGDGERSSQGSGNRGKRVNTART